MRTPARIAGHPIHPMLVTIPIGLWVFSLVCDFISMGSSHPETWSTSAFYAMVGGIIGALCAAVPGLIDLLSLQDKAIKRTALTHMTLNLIIVVLYLVNAWMRGHGAAPAGTPLVLSIVAICMLLVSGWLGGKMVFEAGVAVTADDTAASNEDWVTGRSAGARPAATTGMRRFNPDRAMASDESRDPGDRAR